jgi:hypothetical protein
VRESAITEPGWKVRNEVCNEVCTEQVADCIGDSAAHQEGVAARVRGECSAQGAPEKVEDAAIIARVVTLAWSGRARGPKSSSGLTARGRTPSGRRAESRHAR